MFAEAANLVRSPPSTQAKSRRVSSTEEKELQNQRPWIEEYARFDKDPVEVWGVMPVAQADQDGICKNGWTSYTDPATGRVKNRPISRDERAWMFMNTDGRCERSGLFEIFWF